MATFLVQNRADHYCSYRQVINVFYRGETPCVFTRFAMLAVNDTIDGAARARRGLHPSRCSRTRWHDHGDAKQRGGKSY